MYLVDTTIGNGYRCETIDDVKKIRPEIITAVYMLQKVDYDSLIGTQEIREAIIHRLKGDQMLKEDLVNQLAEELDVKRSEVSKVITQMKKEKFIYSVVDFRGWIGMD